MSPTAVHVENLRYIYTGKKPVVANDNLSFEIPRGEIFGLLGPNGAGKTTLILQLMGLLKPTSGSICLEGIDVIRTPSKVSQIVGFLPQSGLPMRFIEVERALYFTGRLRGQTHADAQHQTRALLDNLGMIDYAKRFVNDLSGGMLRLANFAMALMGHPQVLILDEPTNELDPVKRRQVWDMIAHLNREQGVTCILVTHNLLEAEKVVQRVAIMQAGRFVTLGTPGNMKLSSSGCVRLDFHLKAGAPEALLAILASFGEVTSPRPGQHSLTLRPDQVAHATEMVMAHIPVQELEDFRVSPPSLEEVYLNFAQQHALAGESHP